MTEEKNNIIQKRWLSVEHAEKEIRAFERRFGEKHLLYASHAALPLILTPELLNLIRINFTGAVPWIAEADLPLSSLCRYMDEEIYEFEPRIRELLLKTLGGGQAFRVAMLLQTWRTKRTASVRMRDMSASYQWIVWAYLEPRKVLREMEAYLNTFASESGDPVRRAEQIRIVSMAEIISGQMIHQCGDEYGSLLEQTRKLARDVYDPSRHSGDGRVGTGEPDPGHIRKVETGISELKLEFAYIPPGTFMMGSPENEPERFGNEKQHEVTLTKGFYMQTTPVTQGQYMAVTGTNPSNFKDGGPDCPVENVSWEDAQAFIKKLNEISEHRFRLPTEAEWEYACRAGTKTPFWTGKCLGTDQANYDGNYPMKGCSKGEYRKKTTPVTRFEPNPWGLHDMHGNVWEWCEDWYGEYPEGAAIDPPGPSTGSDRVLRGGSWYDYARDCRSANRDWGRPGDRNGRIGFRLVCLPGQ